MIFLPVFSTLILIIFLKYLRTLINSMRGIKLNLPPSPPKLPIIGNLHQLGELPHRSLKALSNKYGPLMLLHLGQNPTLIVSSPQMAKEMMTTNDLVFSNRPQSAATRILFYGSKDMAFSPHGEYWKQTRKFSVVEFLSMKKVTSFQCVRDAEVGSSIDQIKQACRNGTYVNMSEILLTLSSDIVCRCVIGRLADEGSRKELAKLSKTMNYQVREFNFGDMFPYLRWIDVLTGYLDRLKQSSKSFDIFCEKVIAEHKLRDESDTSIQIDFLHILLQLQKTGLNNIQLDHENIKAILLDMIVGATDTVAAAIEWMMTELIRNPRVMKKTQEEIREVVGNKLKIESSDIGEMHYLKCVMKETLRLHAPAPLLSPRLTSTSVKIGGYDIPAKTTVLVNAFAIQTDPSLWDNPEDFIPERFENKSIDYIAKEFNFLPFGGGRRQCPGIPFGITLAENVIANFLYWFDWELYGDQVDTTEVLGLTMHKKMPLQLIPTLWSHN